MKETAEKEEGAAKVDPPPTTDNPTPLDGADFLSHLRASGLPDHNDDTIGVSNTDKHRRDISSLSDLFENHSSDQGSPGRAHDKKADTKLPPRPPPMHSRNRSVSWGNNSMMNTRIQQPTLDESIGSPMTQEARLQVEDLLTSGPYEQEAETNILRALEEQQALRVRADTGSSSILSGVPETVAHDFTLSPSMEEMQEQQDNEPPPARRESLMKREQSRSLLNHQRNTHRRTMSVEETLAGLTSAMTALDHTHNPARMDQEEPASSADQFAQNAALLTRHDEEQRPRQTAKDRWNHVLMNLPTLKEAEEREETGLASDDSDAREEDVEAGVPVAEETTFPPKRKVKRSRHSKVFQKSVHAANDKFKDDWETWKTFFKPRKEHVWSYIKLVLVYLIIPLTGIAAILYYLVDNPPTGKSEDGSNGVNASASWWLLFVVRQAITFSLALSIQMVCIDFLALGTKIVLRLVGPILTLLLVQAKGWPFVTLWWSILDFAMLYGDGRFAKHWLFWQDAIGMFNKRNPSGNVVNSYWNMRILTIAISVSAAVAVKRFLIGLYLSRQTYGKLIYYFIEANSMHE